MFSDNLRSKKLLFNDCPLSACLCTGPDSSSGRASALGAGVACSKPGRASYHSESDRVECMSRLI